MPEKEEKKNNIKKNKLKKDKNQLDNTQEKKNNSKLFYKDIRFKKIVGLFFIILGFFLIVSFISYFISWEKDFDKINQLSAYDLLLNTSLNVNNFGGKIGAVLAHLLITRGFGIASFAFILLLTIIGCKMFLNIRILPIFKTFIYSFIFLLWFPVCLSFIFTKNNLLILGGTYGYEANIWLESLIGKTGTALLLTFILLTFCIVTFNINFSFIFKKSIKENKTENDDNVNVESIENINLNINKEKDLEENNINDDPFFVVENFKEQNINTINNNGLTIENSENDDDITHINVDAPYDPTLDLPDFKLPTIDLLEDYNSGNVTVEKEELESNKNKIIETLNNYSIKIDKIKATIGPTVTLYEIIPAPGVRISKIKNLEDDIALSLSALGIRIIAPMPGKGTIGIEVPNLRPEIVSMKSMLTSEKFLNSPHILPIALGKTISNESYIADLTKMPHLLMAGATGQGKSVGLNAIITSLLYKKHPAYIKFVLIDPKKVELTLFSKIERHYLARLPDCEEAIITDTRKVVRTLNSLCIEMEQRYDLLKDAQVRNIKEYNTHFISRKLNPNDGHRFLPYIIVIIDEFADLIMTAGKEVETPLTRLAQLARAIGIHLIIATQRPSVNIITGTIKANFPARIAFRVISKIDSRTILDMGGADQLIGRGDMLLSTGSDLVRLQCPFVDTPEIDRITEFIGSQRAYPEAFLLPDCPDESSDETTTFDPNERDELFAEAARIIVQHQHGSTSLLQRKLKLGYNRAGRIIDQLEAAGIVGPFEGSKAREVKIKDEITLEQFLSNLNNNA
ncbi:MAG TPA: DNA translocase FtsK 4TM domain-containing protein [Bacteroidales bacterium]|nr:DNA translocase FtsK 4TM domain-containing protein [Bacteroidales bacterium]